MRILTFAGIGGLALGIALPVFAAQTTPFEVDVTTSPNPFAIKGTTSVNGGAGILAVSSGTKNSALEGYANGQNSAGLEGFANSSSGTASNGVFGYAMNGYGMLGGAASSSYAGVAGSNTGTASGAIGTSGTAGGINGVGVYGTTLATTATAGYGVFGLDTSESGSGTGVGGSSQNGTGVFGETVGANGVGVEGLTDNTTAAPAGSTIASEAVYGLDAASSGGPNAGVFGQSTLGFGVFAESVDNVGLEGVSGDDHGVVGVTYDERKFGNVGAVFGDDQSGSSSITNDIGVEGQSYYGQGVLGTSTAHQGVFGQSQSDTGTAGISTSGDGVVGESTSGTAGAFYQIAGSGSSNAAAAPALYVSSKGGDDIIVAYGQTSTTSSGKDVMTLDVNGNMVLAGGLTEHGAPQSTVRDATGAQRVAYAQRATQATIEDFGRTEMTNGVASVRLDPAFASTLADGDYLVFLTAEGMSNSLYIANRTLAGFEIRGSEAHATMGVEYRIVGHPRAERAEPRLAYLATASGARDSQDRVAADVRAVAAHHRLAQPPARATHRHLATAFARRPHTFAVPKPPRAPQIPQIGWKPGR